MIRIFYNVGLNFLWISLLGAHGSILHAQPSQSGWLADPRGCKVANPTPQPTETIDWSGNCKDGFADGPGTVHWFTAGKSNGITSGTFKLGKLMGKGYVTLPRMFYSQADTPDRKRNTRHPWPAGSRLDGDFMNNRLIGIGTITMPNGQTVLVSEVNGKLVRKGRAFNTAATPMRAPVQ